MIHPVLKITGRTLTPNETTRRLNPHLYLVGAVETAKPEPHQRRRGEDRGVEEGPSGVVVRVCLVALRRRLLDRHDNMRSACKPLVDAITATLGFRSDDDPALEWEYGQQRTAGSEGVMVKIEVCETKL